MPWRETSVMEERLRFVARLLEGEGMSDVCREFGISRKTGYKIFNRYKDEGLEALTDRSRRPVRYANQLPAQIETQIVSSKKSKPHRGARKIRELLVRKLAGDMRIPSTSTVHAILDRHGLVTHARHRHRNKAEGTGHEEPGRRLLCIDKSLYGPAGYRIPFRDRDALVTNCGRICIYRKKINISIVMAGQKLGIKEVDDGIWLVSFMQYDLGYIDLEQKTLQTIDNPFGTRLSPMS
ncbi:helix-turn-helix domain containing protein [Rhizobium wenxiniae]|uniref:helix-turn-helix domain-containing protein n=1 Tax=Rhizobium wenxiniae TaxID=1737357 RepID=UPI001C6E1806|nr:helix-turn-helix domain-containing protein [Rhizobium wenxiniae]MBW9089343.1 helix-turn-helix domain containing protein [Rhizobium wenxiniae]